MILVIISPFVLNTLSLLMDTFENPIPTYFGKSIAIRIPAHPGK